jgi:hypothetical protein
MFAYPFVLEPLGYLVSSFLLMFLLIRMMVKKTWWFAPAAACSISLASYVLFKVLLKVPLPDTHLGF